MFFSYTTIIACVCLAGKSMMEWLSKLCLNDFYSDGWAVQRQSAFWCFMLHYFVIPAFRQCMSAWTWTADVLLQDRCGGWLQIDAMCHFTESSQINLLTSALSPIKLNKSRRKCICPFHGHEECPLQLSADERVQRYGVRNGAPCRSH